MRRSALQTLFAAIVGAAGLQLTPADAAINFVGLTVPWREDKPSTADTIGGNPSWNAYIRPSGGSFLNDGDDAGSRFSVALEPGTYTFEVLVQHQSWADDSVANPGSYLNLFFDGRVNPGISARLAGGNFGALAPLTTSERALVQNDEDGSLVAPAGTLLYRNFAERLQVELISMTMEVVDDTVSAWNVFPSGSEQDTKFTFTLQVAIPEPSTALLGLIGLSALGLRRRR